jgi:prevent-host-death family protein
MNLLRVTATELKRHTGSLLDRVKYGNTRIIVEKGGVEFVVIDPAPPYKKASLEKYRGAFKNLEKNTSKVRKELNLELNKKIS